MSSVVPLYGSVTSNMKLMFLKTVKLPEPAIKFSS